MATVTEKINFDDGIEYAVPAARRSPGGVSIRRDPLTGADVFMYKRKPGVYYSGHGTEVSETMAKRAGFDTVFLALERKRQTDVADYQAMLKAQSSGEMRRTIVEYGGFRLEEQPKVGFYVVRVEDETIMTKERAPTEQMGRDWLADFAGPPPAEGFDGTAASVKVADDDISGPDRPGVGRADRRPGQDAKPNRDVRKAGNP